MSALRYKALISYLPGLATVVNSFATPEVQVRVFETLIGALNDKLQAEGVGLPNGQTTSALLREPVLRMTKPAVTSTAAPDSDSELAHDIVDGDSIHALESN